MNLYLDMDGVLADFIGGFIKASGLNLTNADVREWGFFREYMTEEEFWSYCGTHKFWDSLEPLPWARLLYAMCKDLEGKSFDKVYILTRPKFDIPGSITGKLSWLNKHFPGNDRVIFANDKEVAAKSGVLIDDSEKNVSDFKKAGGRAILFPQYWNSFGTIVENPIEYVAKEISNILRTEYQELPDSEVRSVNTETGAEKGMKLARYDLIPTAPLRMLAKHYGAGTLKYADRNWEKGYEWSKSYSAAQRHLNQFWDGENVDEETGSLHIIAAAWHCFALAEYFMSKKGTDDRPGQNSLS